MTAPLGDLIYDLLHAIVLNDDVEMEESALALAKATAAGVKDSRIDGSPTLPEKLQRLRKRLKQTLGDRGLGGDDDDDFGAPATAATDTDTDEDGLPSLGSWD